MFIVLYVFHIVCQSREIIIATISSIYNRSHAGNQQINKNFLVCLSAASTKLSFVSEIQLFTGYISSQC